MPLIIRELVIRASVEQGGTAGASTVPPEADTGAGGDARKREQGIVAECVEQVLDILKAKEAR